MTSEDWRSVGTPTVLDILVFTVGEVHCGIDGEHIGRMLMLEEASEGTVHLRWFHQAVSFGDKVVNYRNPWVITMKGSTEGLGLVIDQPRDLINVPIRSIRPLPAFFAISERLRPFWGAFILDKKVVLLIDPCQLLR